MPGKAAEEHMTGLITSIFQAWQQKGIDFLILRNYEELPRFTSNDIDVLVRPAQRDLAEQMMVEAARAAGFRRHNRAEFATLANYFYHPGSGTQAHFDLFTNLKWRSFDFLPGEEFLEQRGSRGLFSIPHPAHEAATNLLATMIYNGRIKESYKATITQGFRDHGTEAKRILAIIYGNRLADLMVEAGASEQWNTLQRATGKLRRALILRQLLHRPFSVLCSAIAEGRRLTRRWWRPPGLAVVLCGPDGSGKSSAGRALVEELSVTFAPLKGRQFHWKPPVFSGNRMAQRAPTTDPHAAPARGMMGSLIYFTFHWLEFFLSAAFRIRPVTFKNGLVIIDRWYYDFFVDQRRYRLRVGLPLVRLGYFFLKKPDLVLLLDAPAEILHQRKPEVALAETRRQREEYLALVRTLPQGRVIDASQPLAGVLRDMKAAVLEFMEARSER